MIIRKNGDELNTEEMLPRQIIGEDFIEVSKLSEKKYNDLFFIYSMNKNIDENNNQTFQLELKKDDAMLSSEYIKTLDDYSYCIDLDIEKDIFDELQRFFNDENNNYDLKKLFATQKNKLKKDLSNNCLKQNIILTNIDYDIFGYFYSNNIKVGTFDQFKIVEEIIEEIVEENKFIFNFNKICHIGKLEDISNLIAEFIINNKKYRFEIEKIENDLYTSKLLEVIDNIEPYKVDPQENFNNLDELMVNRKTLLDSNIKFNIFDEFDDDTLLNENANKTTNESKMIDDFDFDF